MKRALLVVGCVALLTMVIAPSLADTIWHLGNPPQAPYNGVDEAVPPAPQYSFTRTMDGIDVTGYGFNFNGDGTVTDVGNEMELWFKVLGTDEHGLGPADQPDHELALTADGTMPVDYIQVDLQNLININAKNVSIDTESVTSPEAWDLWGSNTLGVSGIGVNPLLTDMTTEDVYTLIPDFGAWRYVTLTVHPDPNHPANNILMDDITAQVPEPGTLCLLLLGLPALGILKRKRFA
jgi:hypothetical protein